MNIKCKNLSNRGNGKNCKISPKNPLYQCCSFNRGCSKLNGGLNQSDSIIVIKNLNDCHAKRYEHDYWLTKIVPQVQEVLRVEDEKEEREKRVKQKEKILLEK